MTHVIEIRDNGIVTHRSVSNPDDYNFIGDVETYSDRHEFEQRVAELS